MIYEIEVEGRKCSVSVRRAPGGGWTLQVDDGPEEHVQGGQIDAAEWLFDFGGRRRSIGCHVVRDAAAIQVAGYALRANVVDPRDRALGLGGGATEGVIATPMPGVIVRVPVAEGASVNAGDVVVVVEAMKMENEYKTPVAGVVAKIHVAAGQAVESGAVLVTVEPQ